MKQILNGLLGFYFVVKALLWIILWLSATFLIAADSLPKGSLSGRIVDPVGKPVPGARVWINTSGDKILAEARSNAEGRFMLGDLEPCFQLPDYIFIDVEEFARQYIPNMFCCVFPGINYDLGDIQVDHGRIYSGQVLDEDGKPAPDAKVFCNMCIRTAGHTVFRFHPEYQIKLDSEGRYRTPPLAAGKMHVVASAPEMQNVWLNRTVQSGGEEKLEPLRLKREVPILGTVKDEQGKPIAGAEISVSDICTTTSDANGRFILHGFWPKPRFQFQLSKDGYLFINWVVQVRDDGIYWQNVSGKNPPEYGPDKELSVVLKPVAWIEGYAKDADTGEPVQLDKVVLCFFERKANGEVVLSGCRSWGFEQPEVGRFRISYANPDEYHLTFSAPGYHDAEAYTPKVTELKKSIVLRLKCRKRAKTPNP
jgi:uncharacterized GH25 family protein